MEILQNLVHMTGQRDHLRLEVSVLSTLLKLPCVTHVRALELLPIDGQLWIRPRTWTENGQLVSTDIDFENDPQRHPLDHIPTMQSCLQHKQQRCQSHDPATNTYTLWLPVWMHEQVRICLEVRQQGKEFDAQELDVLLGIFQVYYNYQSLLDYSERDALTGLLNRKTFDDHLQRLTLEPGNSTCCCSEPGSPRQPWLAVLDIDHFKKVNDSYGHLFGDEVLILVSNLLRSCFGLQHQIFRFGGEEFVLLLAPMTQAQAERVLEGFRQTVEHYPFPQVGQVTISLGFAGTRRNSNTSPVQLLAQADEALYYAKENGRNQVCQYEQLEAQGLLGSKQTITHDAVELF